MNRSNRQRQGGREREEVVMLMTLQKALQGALDRSPGMEDRGRAGLLAPMLQMRDRQAAAAREGEYSFALRKCHVGSCASPFKIVQHHSMKGVSDMIA